MSPKEGGVNGTQPKRNALTPEQLQALVADAAGLFTPAQTATIYGDMGSYANIQHLVKFLYYCTQRNLNPLLGEVHAELRYDKRTEEYRMAIITHIDAYRKIADLTGKYDGQSTTYLHGAKGDLVGATVTIHRKDCGRPFEHACFLSEYTTGYGNWTKMPHVMIAKCAEAGAFRKAFPAALSGLYINEEMGRVDKDNIDTGGHPMGTRAAQEYVRDKKIAEFRAAEAPGPEPQPGPAPLTIDDHDLPVELGGTFVSQQGDKPWSTKREMKERFSAMKEAIGEAAYNDVLGLAGVGDPGQFTNPCVAVETYRKLQELAAEVAA